MRDPRQAVLWGLLSVGAIALRPFEERTVLTDEEVPLSLLPQDEREAARYRLAAEQGDAWAQYQLGLFYEDGRGGLPKDEREAARLYKLAADQGNASAQVHLGPFYDRGRGGHRSVSRVRPILARRPLHRITLSRSGRRNREAQVFSLSCCQTSGKRPVCNIKEPIR